MNRTPLAVPLLLAVLPPVLAQEKAPDPLAEAIERTLAEQHIPGAVVGPLRGDELVVRRAFGVRDVASAAPMTTEALFQIGSVTKVHDGDAARRAGPTGQSRSTTPSASTSIRRARSPPRSGGSRCGSSRRTRRACRATR
jgi:hypothetical protein